MSERKVSPCSVPEFLRPLIPFETDRQQDACRRHDERYEEGGDRRARLVTDLCFALDLLGCSPALLEQVMADTAWLAREGAMEPDDAERYCWAVRWYAGPHWHGGDSPGALPPQPPTQTEAP